MTARAPKARPWAVLAFAACALASCPRTARGAPPATAAPARVLVAIGNNVGDPGDTPLRWAEADAQRVASLFVDFGEVLPERAKVLTGQSADRVREALAEARGRVDELSAGGKDVVLIVYVSSHARAGALHLGGSHLPLAEIRRFLGESRARLKIGIVDACDSGVLARQKGGAPGPDFAVGLTAGDVRGMALITSSGPAEASQEWASLKGSLFTHHLLTGLRGDADADDDGQVTLGEVYGYARRRTVQGAAAGGQHPTFDLDVTGTGELVLSAPRKGRSAVVLPPRAQGHYIVSSQHRPDVVAEVHKVAGRPLRLAVPPGRYLVQKRLGLKVGLQSVELPFGGEAQIDEAGFELRGFGEVAMKGDDLEVRPWAAFVVGALQNQQLDGTGLEWRAGLGVRRGLSAFFVGASLVGAGRSFRGRQLAVSELSGALRLEGGYRFLELPVVPLLGVLGEARLVRQATTRDAEAIIEEVYRTGPLPARVTLGLSVGPLVGLEVPLGARLFAQVRAVGLIRFLPSDLQPAITWGLEGALLVGGRF